MVERTGGAGGEAGGAVVTRRTFLPALLLVVGAGLEGEHLLGAVLTLLKAVLRRGLTEGGTKKAQVL